MKINAILFGSTGMIGQGVLQECLENSQVESVLAINRHSCQKSHQKLKEIIHKDFFDLYSIASEFTKYNTCFFCLGVSSAGLSEVEYHKITYDLTTSIANTLLTANRDITFCYISGAGTDSSEIGHSMWARVKGKTENALLKLPFKNAIMFRPGYIHPMKGIKSRTRLYNILYAILKPLYFIIKHFESIATNTETLGKAMINAVASGSKKNILESIDINNIGKRSLE